MKPMYLILLLAAFSCGSPKPADQVVTADTVRTDAPQQQSEEVAPPPPTDLFVPSGDTITIKFHDQLLLTVLVPSDVVMNKEIEQMDNGFQLSGSVQITKDTTSNENGDFTYQIYVADGACQTDEMAEGPPEKKTINDIEFTVSHSEDNAMHMFYSNYSYDFEWKGACIDFTLSFSASTYSEPADNVYNTPRDQGPYIAAFERFLGTIVLK